MWKGHILAKVIERAHTGPVFAMYSSIKENKILSAGKERRYDICLSSYLLILSSSFSSSFFHFLFYFHLFSCSYDAHIKAWDIGMKEAQEYKLTHYPKATIRSVCQGENVSPQTNIYIYIYTHIT